MAEKNPDDLILLGPGPYLVGGKTINIGDAVTGMDEALIAHCVRTAGMRVGRRGTLTSEPQETTRRSGGLPSTFDPNLQPKLRPSEIEIVDVDSVTADPVPEELTAEGASGRGEPAKSKK